MNPRTPAHVTAVVLATVVVGSIVGPALMLSPWVSLFAVVSVVVLGCELADRPITSPWPRVVLVAAGGAFFVAGDVQVGAAGLACAGLVVTQLGRDRDRGLCLGLALAVAALTLATEPPRTVTAIAVLACTIALAGGMLLGRTDFGAGTVARTQVPARPVRDALRAVVAPVVGFVVVSLGVFLLLPQPEPMIRQNPAAAAASGLGTGGSSRPLAGYVGGPMQLNNRGDLPDVPIVKVPLDSPQLWRVSVLDAYTGQGWSPVDGGLALPLWPAGPQDQTYLVEPLRGYRGEVPAPGAPAAVTPGVAHRTAGFRVLNYTRDPFGVQVGPYSEVESPGPGIPGADGLDDPADPRWTALPASVTERTRSLAREVTGGSEDPVAASQAIAAYLTSGEYAYDLDAPVAAAGRDSVDHFLFESRSGYCEHYASAAVVMLRSLGIPARVAVGYSGGTPDGDMRTVRGTQAHAWVEVHVPGRGWVTSDPTPAAEPGLADLLTGRQAQLVGGLVLVIGALVGLLVWLRRDRRPTPVRPEPEPNDPVFLALKRLRAAMRVARVPSYPGQTLAEVARLLPYITEDLELVQRHLYGGEPVSQLELHSAIDALDRASASLLALSGETDVTVPAEPAGSR